MTATALAQFASPHWQSRPEPDLLPSGIPGLSIPRGSLTEIYGPPSSGRTSLMISILSEATSRQETCALVDAEDAFDPASAAQAGVALDRLIWVRSENNAEHALKAADLLIQGGGFGVVALDLGDLPGARRISMTSWFRLRRAVENTPTVLLALSSRPNARTCASLLLECRRERIAWSGAASTPHGRLLRGIDVRATSTQRSKVCTPAFTARAI